MRNTHTNKGVGWGLAAGAASILALVSLTQPSSADEFVNTGYFGDVAIKGTKRFAHRWLGATWHFASAENRELFKQDPVAYAPQYGGHCADGVSFGTITTNIDPEAWRIIEGKLYLSYDPGAADGLVQNPDKVASSQKYWPEVQQTLVAEKQAAQSQ